jgi:hypothetical protein
MLQSWNNVWLSVKGENILAIVHSFRDLRLERHNGVQVHLSV